MCFWNGVVSRKCLPCGGDTSLLSRDASPQNSPCSWTSRPIPRCSRQEALFSWGLLGTSCHESPRRLKRSVSCREDWEREPEYYHMGSRQSFFSLCFSRLRQKRGQSGWLGGFVQEPQYLLLLFFLLVLTTGSLKPLQVNRQSWKWMRMFNDSDIDTKLYVSILSMLVQYSIYTF